MDVQPLLYKIELLLRKKGILFLLLPILLFSFTAGFAAPPVPPEKASGTHHRQASDRINQSQEILRALFLEHRHRYTEARKIWETLPQANESVKDHIFQTGLMEQNPLVLEAIPITAASIRVAVSYLKWQKKWDKAYQLLKRHSVIVAKNENLRLIEVTLALYLRKYEDAELLLLEMTPQDILDKARLRVLWSWYYALSGGKNGSRSVIADLDKHTLYQPAALVLIELWGDPWPEIKKRALQALTRFPSNRELIEEIVIIFRNHDAWKEIGTIIVPENKHRSETANWRLAANVYLQTGQENRLKQLLHTVPENERQRIEFLDYVASIAVREKEWGQLKRVLDQYRKLYPYLRDGDLYLAEYEN